MADVLRVSTPSPTAASERQRVASADPGGWLLMLVPTGICVMMFVIAACW
ncbi:MAG TPA: hypothetical protein VEX66_04715 [Microlunatus sp.]|jgi:hypothetical protein|nr:hypothetical protein [Microlunatus sp.]